MGAFRSAVTISVLWLSLPFWGADACPGGIPSVLHDREWGESGFRCVAAVAAVAEHSIMHQFASGRRDQKDLEELGQFARSI